MTERRVLYVVVCGAGPASHVGTLVGLAQQRGWEVCLIATPAGREFLNLQALEAQIGRRVKSDYNRDDRLPHADAVIVAPATYNTINKWATGIADNYPLTLLAELTGLSLPIVVLPFVNSALATNPAFTRSINQLRQTGIQVLIGPGEFEPHPPGTGGNQIATYPWGRALARIHN